MIYYEQLQGSLRFYQTIQEKEVDSKYLAPPRQFQIYLKIPPKSPQSKNPSRKMQKKTKVSEKQEKNYFSLNFNFLEFYPKTATN